MGLFCRQSIKSGQDQKRTAFPGLSGREGLAGGGLEAALSGEGLSAPGRRARCLAGSCGEMGFQGCGRNKARTWSWEVAQAVNGTWKEENTLL